MDIEYIKKSLETLYKTNPNIHISIQFPRPRIVVEETPAVLVGVYKNIFQVEEKGCKFPTRHSFQYGDILVGHVKISELSITTVTHAPNQKQ